VGKLQKPLRTSIGNIVDVVTHVRGGVEFCVMTCKSERQNRGEYMETSKLKNEDLE